MFRYLRWAAAFVLGGSLLAQPSGRDQQFRDDLHYLATELPKRHVNAFHQTSAVQFNASVSALDAEIPQLGDTEVMVRMAQIVASIGDAHTSLPLPQGRTLFRWFPFTFFGFEDGWRVNAVRSDLTRLLGCKIIQIGDTPIDDAVAKVASVISHENDQWVKQQFPSYAMWADVLKTVGIVDNLDSARWTFETIGGERFSLEIATIPQGSISGIALPDGQGFKPLYQQNTTQNYWYTYLESTRTLYFAYNQCADSATRPFSAFAQELFTFFDSNPVDRLVIDLRNNPGGNSAVLDPFLAGLQARQSRFANGTKKMVIIGRRTASSAMLERDFAQGAAVHHTGGRAHGRTAEQLRRDPKPHIAQHGSNAQLFHEVFLVADHDGLSDAGSRHSVLCPRRLRAARSISGGGTRRYTAGVRRRRETACL